MLKSNKVQMRKRKSTERKKEKENHRGKFLADKTKTGVNGKNDKI